MHIRKKLLWLIVFSTIIRLVLAATLELGNDEVYYWTYALHLQWNYFDHPPMVALLVRLGTCNGYFHQEMFVRAGAVACAALTTWLIFLTGEKLAGSRAGWYAALLYTSSVYFSLLAGLFILPDSPQVLFWVASLFIMLEVIERVQAGRRSNGLLLLLGITIGLSVMSKIHGVFLWAGFLMYIICYDRRLLRKPALYLSMLVTAAIVSPILIWNIQNHFITFTYHNSRISLLHKKPDWDNFLQHVTGSILYNNPVNVVLYVIAMAGMMRAKAFAGNNPLRLLLMLGFPLILVLLFLSLFNQTLPHWSGPAYLSFLLIAATYYAIVKRVEKTPAALVGANLLLLVAAVGIALLVRLLPVPVGNRDARILGDGDVTLDLFGWRQFGNRFDSIYQADVQQHTMHPGAFVLSNKWFPAADLDYYVASPLHAGFFAVGSLGDLHHYAWLNKTRPALVTGDDAYFIYPSNYYRPADTALLRCFSSVDEPVSILQFRAGIRVRNFVVTRLHGYKGGIPRDGVMEKK